MVNGDEEEKERKSSDKKKKPRTHKGSRAGHQHWPMEE